MTIVLKEAARRRITRRRKTESNATAREYSQRAPEERGGVTAPNGSLSYGLLAGLPGSVDEFLRERHECDGL